MEHIVTAVGMPLVRPLAAVGALEGTLPAVDARVLLEMVLELERLGALATRVLAQRRALLVTQQVALQSVDVGKRLAADLHGNTRQLTACR